MRVTRASSKLRMASSSSSSLSAHRVTNSTITKPASSSSSENVHVASSRLLQLPNVVTSSSSSSSFLSDDGTAATSITIENDSSSSVPEDSTVTASTPCDIQELPCSCGSLRRPTDPSLYYRRRCLLSNRVTERYILSNLGITQRQLDYIIGATLSLKDSIATLLQTPHTVHQAFPTSLFRVSWGGTVLYTPQIILPTLLDHCTVSDVNLELPLTDSYSPSIADDSAWVLQELDFAAPLNMQLSHHRQFLCGFFIPLFLRLCTLSSGMLEQEVAAKLVPGMPYCRYLAVRLVLGNVLMLKRSAWSTFVMTRKIEVIWV